MYVRVNTASRQNGTFTGNDFGTGADNNIDIVLNIGVTRFTDTFNSALFDTNICFNDSPVIENQGIGNH